MMTSEARRPVILIVEDEPLARFDTILSFEDAGFEVVDAYDADKALLALAHRPDVGAVFTDVNMPGRLNGVELARLVHEQRPDIQVLIASGAVHIGGDDLPAGGRFIAKPYNAAHVAGLIRQGLDDALALAESLKPEEKPPAPAIN
jgi:CheY-like chemotaxis protein